MPYDQDVPECLLGSLFALEGVKDSMTILNGPTGCKYYPASLSEDVFSKEGTFNPYTFMDRFFFSQPRIPCTYLDGNDLIMGTDEKLAELVEIVVSKHPKMIGIVNSPGASLIGSKLDFGSDDIPRITSESPGYSASFEDGFQNTVIKILDKLAGKKKFARRMSINLVGLSIDQLNWQDSIDDLKSLLRLCGIDVIAVAGAGWSVDEIKESVNASLNVILYSNLGDKIAKWYTDNCFIPSVNPSRGIPLGFDQIASWINTVCGALRCDPSPALAAIDEARKHAAMEIKRANLFSGLPSGCTFSISGCGPMVYSVLVTLHSYLGMVPVAIETTDDSQDGRILTYLSDNGIEVTNDVFDTPADVYLGSGTMIASLEFRGLIGGGVNIEMPSVKTVRIAKEPILGIGGTIRLLDQTMNCLEKTL